MYSSNLIVLSAIALPICLFINFGVQEECERTIFHQNYTDNDTSKVKYLGGAYMDTITVSLSGIFIDRKSLLPLSGVSILLKDSANVLHTTTDKAGEFKFLNFSKGETYSLYCNFPEYKCVIIDSIKLRSGISLQLSVRMFKKA